MAKEKKTTKNPPVDPSEFGDMGPVEAAPDEKAKAKPEPKKPVEAKPAPKPEPLKEIVLSAKDVLAALLSGQVSGLPRQPDCEPKLTGNKKEVILIANAAPATAAIAGHAVDCDLITEVRLVKWHVRGSADQLSGKYRLMNNITMAIGGNVVPLKAGKEFSDHQLSVEAVKQAGGVVLPIGTQK